MGPALQSSVASITSTIVTNCVTALLKGIDQAFEGLNAGALGDAAGETPDVNDVRKFAAIEQGEPSPRCSGAARNGHAQAVSDEAARSTPTNDLWSHLGRNNVAEKAWLCGSLFRFTASDGLQYLQRKGGFFPIDGPLVSVVVLGNARDLVAAKRVDDERFILRNDGSVFLRGPIAKVDLLGEAQQFFAVTFLDGLCDLYRVADGSRVIQGVDGLDEERGRFLSVRLRGKQDRYVEVEMQGEAKGERLRVLHYSATGTPILFKDKRRPGERYEMLAGGDYIKIIDEKHKHERIALPNGKPVLDAAFSRITAKRIGRNVYFLGRGLRHPVGRARSLLRKSSTDILFAANGNVLVRGRIVDDDVAL